MGKFIELRRDSRTGKYEGAVAVYRGRIHMYRVLTGIKRVEAHLAHEDARIILGDIKTI